MKKLFLVSAIAALTATASLGAPLPQDKDGCRGCEAISQSGSDLQNAGKVKGVLIGDPADPTDDVEFSCKFKMNLVLSDWKTNCHQLSAGCGLATCTVEWKLTFTPVAQSGDGCANAQVSAQIRVGSGNYAPLPGVGNVPAPSGGLPNDQAVVLKSSSSTTLCNAANIYVTIVAKVEKGGSSAKWTNNNDNSFGFKLDCTNCNYHEGH